jgi:hypothetical protein
MLSKVKSLESYARLDDSFFVPLAFANFRLRVLAHEPKHKHVHVLFTRTPADKALCHIRAHTRTLRHIVTVCPSSQEAASGAPPVHDRDGGPSAGSGNVSGEITMPAEDR